MAALATFIGSIFATALSFVTLYLVKRIAIIAALIAILTASVVAFALVMQGLLNQLNVAYPTGSIATGLSMLPSNTNLCVSIIVTTYIASWAHNWFVKMVTMRSI